MPMVAGRRIRLGLTLKLLIVADLAIMATYGFFTAFAFPRMDQNLIRERETRAQQEVEMARDVLQYHYRLETSGLATRSQAQAQAIEQIGSLVSASDEIWVCDSGPVLLCAPSMPDRLNTDVGDLRDAEGRAVFADMVRISGSGGEGSYRYTWQPTGESGSEATVAYVKSFDPWGWTVSAGASVQDLGSVAGGYKFALWWLGGAVATVSFGMFWFATRAAVIKPLDSLRQTSEALAMGDVDQQVKVGSNDELGDMAGAYASVIDYMKEIANITTKIADGDLTVPIRPRSEKDVLSHSFARMVSRQRELIGGVKGAAASVAEASESLSQASEQTARVTQQIANTIQQVARGTGEQSACLQEIMANEQSLSRSVEQIASGSEEQAASAEEAARMVKQVAASASQVLGNAQAGTEAWKRTAKSAEAGARTTYETIEGMKKMKEAIDLVSLRVADLGQRSREIGSIVATIDDIAAQTNLLALNAAIEAARAGDQGRGFAVVADEVRKLAERSSVATREIAALIGSIQTGVSEAVKAMERGSREVESGYGLAGEAGTALEDILESSQAVGQQVNQITAAAEELNALSGNMVNVIQQISKTIEQNAAATEAMAGNSSSVSNSIESVSSVAGENSASAQEVSASVEEMSAGVEEVLASAQTLAEMSADLKASVAAFKTDD
jgi:methyl-accepting chemotaxis protein